MIMTDSKGTEIFPGDLLESRDCPNIPMVRYVFGMDFAWMDNRLDKYYRLTPESMEKSKWVKHIPQEANNPQGRET